MNEILTIILSAVTSVIVAYATSKASNYSKDVVQERKEWRDKIRELTVKAVHLIQTGETQSPEFSIIFSEFRVRLNPDDKDDNDILETLKRSIKDPDEVLGRKLLAQSSRLLKHDWERAKSESRVMGFLYRPNGPNIRLLKSDDYLGNSPK